jgi:hypothetical protein
MFDNKFKHFFDNEPKKCAIHKWIHYLDIYEKHFNKFIGKNPVILEIGLYKGGSLDMWNYYFDNKCTIYGIDIDTNTKQFEKDNVKVVIGDQESPEFWIKFFKENDIYFDMVIDDGGHSMKQQIVTYENVIDRVKDNGVYLCEDLHTSYWSDYGGGYLKNDSFIEYSKNFIDLLNVYHIKDNTLSEHFRKNIWCVSYYDSIIVLDKKKDDEKPIAIEKPVTI